MSNVKNYTEQGGNRTVIGGELDITPEGKLAFDGT
ncbi:sugar-binding protein, partial [Butyricicoccus sp. 1XD8-22]